MYKFFVFILLAFSQLIHSQETYSSFKSEFKFNSVFQDLKDGQFTGTINGALFLQKSDSSELIIDFQGSEATLIVEEDTNKVYDVSTKIYQGFSTSGKTKLTYSTYFQSHNLGIQISDKLYNFNTIDGCCCVLIKDLSFFYKSEARYEYLVLLFEKAVKLGENGVRNTSSYLKILPKSNLTFIIKREP